MFREVKITTIRNIDVKLHPSWYPVFIFVVALLAWSYFPKKIPLPQNYHWLYWLYAAAAGFLLYLSLLLHELSHCIVAQKLGFKVKSITLFILGGIAEILPERKTKPYQEFLMSIAGPLLNIALALLLCITLHFTQNIIVVKSILLYAIAINVVLAGFNLLPCFPMDGGRILKATIWKATGNEIKAIKICFTFSKWLAICGLIYGTIRVLTGNALNGTWLMFLSYFIYEGALHAKHAVILQHKIPSTISAWQIANQDIHIADENEPTAEFMKKTMLTNVFSHLVLTNHKRITAAISFTELAEKINKCSPNNLQQPLKEFLKVTKTNSIPVVYQTKNYQLDPLDLANTFQSNPETKTVVLTERNKILGIVEKKEFSNWLNLFVKAESLNQKANTQQTNTN
ncbi:MAG TPA: hypothetical protein ENF38_01395 [Candidatus Aenigmarchaeota archaeon]|nr:hypothetical protein [Candidatus Aenigmarchaeota archaeon]